MAQGSVASLVVLAALLAGCTVTAPTPLATATARPAAPPVDPVEQYADDRLGVMTLDEKIESMFMVHLEGIDPAGQAAYAAANHVGGLILMGDNIPSPPEALAGVTGALSAEPGLPLLLAVDQEGGMVSRIPTDGAASAAQLRYLDPSAAREAFAARGAMLQGFGISVNFGIVADVTGDPASFIFERSMGATAADAAARVARAVEGESGHVLSTLKHFPGHGVAPGDSHSSIPSTGMSLQDWRAGHAPPFEAGIAAGAEVVMFGHLQFEAVDPEPATLSPLWHELLRDELGFEGLIITDDMMMLQDSGRPDLADQASNAVRAVAAGNTMLLYVGPVDVAALTTAVRNAVLDGTIDEKLIDDAAHRLLVARRTLSGQTGRFVHCFEQCIAIIE